MIIISMKLTPLTFPVQDRLEAIRHSDPHLSSTYAFSSLYIWQKDMKLSLYLDRDLFAVKYGLPGKNTWIFPCGREEKKLEFLKAHLSEPDFTLCYLEEKDAALLSYFGSAFTITKRLSDSEYLYDRTEQETLPGKKFAHLRNHIRRAMRDNPLTAAPLCSDNLPAALRVIDEWNQTHRAFSPDGMRDETSPRLLLENKDALNVHGILVSVGLEPFALVAGYPLSETMFDLCLAKQKSDLSGISVYAKHAFIRSLPPQYRLINAEDDLGLPGLRTLKEQMRPIKKIPIYRAKTSLL